MKVLLVNSFYYRRGGDSTHVLALERLLTERGHQVAVFAMRHPQNLPSPWEEFWPSNVEFGGTQPLKLTPSTWLHPIYSPRVARQLSRLCKTFAPDVVHIHALHHHLTTSVISAAKRLGLPVVWTLHEYRTVCPATDLLRHGAVCERCSGGAYWHGLAGRCKRDSAIRSAAAVAESYLSRATGLHALVDCYVAPSQFLADTVTRMGLPAQRIVVIPNFCDAAPGDSDGPRSGLLYAGRLSREKGIDVLVRACASLRSVPLHVAGDGPDAVRLRSLASELRAPVFFDGWLARANLLEMMNSAELLCVPSVWYENCPIVVLEAMAARLPVLASSIGGLPELLGYGAAGFLAPPGDVQRWTETLRGACNDDGLRDRLAAEAFRRVNSRHSRSAFLECLESVYHMLRSG